MATELEELYVLQLAEQFADKVWAVVGTWDPFARDVVGKQITRAADSIGANIAEAYGRFHYGEKLNLLYYSRGSAYETKYWLNRCRVRKLINDATGQALIAELNEIARQINAFARHVKTQRSQAQPKTARESIAEYDLGAETDGSIFRPPELDWLASLDVKAEPPSSVESIINNSQI